MQNAIKTALTLTLLGVLLSFATATNEPVGQEPTVNEIETVVPDMTPATLNRRIRRAYALAKKRFNRRLDRWMTRHASVAFDEPARRLQWLALSVVVAIVAIVAFDLDLSTVGMIAGSTDLIIQQKPHQPKCIICLTKQGVGRTPVVNVWRGSRVRKWVHPACAESFGAMPVTARGEARIEPERMNYELSRRVATHFRVMNMAREQGIDLSSGDPIPTPEPTPEHIPLHGEIEAVEARAFDFGERTAAGDQLADLVAPSIMATMREQFDTLGDDLRADLGGIPRPRIIALPATPDEGIDLGIVHEVFDAVLNRMRIKDIHGRALNTLIVGPAGTGKTHLAKMLAKALGALGEEAGGFSPATSTAISLISCNAEMTAADLLGPMVPNISDGTERYRKAPSVAKYENGGLLVWDEIDALDDNASLSFNAALAGDTLPLPDGTVAKRHPDFRFIGIANTFGDGRSAQYTGRTQLDAAFLNRFACGQVFMDYSPSIERELCPDTILREAIQTYRSRMVEAGIQRIISTRDLMNAQSLKSSGLFTHEQALDAVFTTWSEADLQRIERAMAEPYAAPERHDMLGAGLLGLLLCPEPVTFAVGLLSLAICALMQGITSASMRATTVEGGEIDDLSKRTHLIIAQNIPSMLRAVEEAEPLTRRIVSSFDEGWIGRSGISDMHGAIEAAQKTHEPDMVKVREMADSLRERFDSAGLISINRPKVWRDTGGRVSARRLLAGDTRFRRGRKKRENSNSGVLSLCIDTGGNACVSPERMFWRAAVGVAAAEALEARGYRVALWGGNFAVGAFRNGDDALKAWRVKAAEEPLNVDLATSALSTWYFRTVNFGAYFLAGEGNDPRGGLGSSQPLTDNMMRAVTGDPNAAVISATHRSGDAKEEAMQSCLSVLRGFGALPSEEWADEEERERRRQRFMD